MLEQNLKNDGQVAYLVMNSPENLNAMNEGMAASFAQVTSDLFHCSELRAVVIMGRGRAFSAGGDLEMLRAKSQKSWATNRQEMMQFYHSFLGLRDLNVPLVCALHGHVVGAGFCFAAACDIRLAEDTVCLSAPFTRLGLYPGMGGTYFLPRAFGVSVARELMLTGRKLNAEQALAQGFLSEVVPTGQLQAAVEKTIEHLLRGGPGATRALIAGQRRQEEPELHRALCEEARAQADCYAGPEFLEGLTALQEKRAASW